MGFNYGVNIGKNNFVCLRVFVFYKFGTWEVFFYVFVFYFDFRFFLSVY